MSDPVTTELIRSALQYAAEEMGLAVRNAAYSPNIKERLDHSCAIFDAQGRLAAQAEHIPVHLGSLPWGLRQTLAYLHAHGITPREGDMIVLELLEEHGAATYSDVLPAMMGLSEVRLRRAVGALPDGSYRAEEFLEGDGLTERLVRLAVTVTVDGDRLRVDYTGTDPQLPGALNAVLGVTLSGVYYAVAALIDPGVPVNEGVLRAVEVHAPEGTLLNPRRPAPVAGGNVETSMRNADLLLRALAPAVSERAPASSGGTMSTTIFGGQSESGPWGFYETIACGMGARPGLDGIDGIHCHMTNTLNTPIEAMERTFPVLMTRYEFRPDTGGAGRFRGGCGVSRAWRLLAGSCTLTLLTERVRVAPRGLNGGGDGGRGAHAM